MRRPRSPLARRSLRDDLYELRRGRFFRRALRGSAPLRDVAVDLDLHHEVAAVLRPAHVEGPIDRQRMMPGLRPLLQQRLGDLRGALTVAAIASSMVRRTSALASSSPLSI